MPYPKPLSPSDALAAFHAELARAAASPDQATAGPVLWPRVAFNLFGRNGISGVEGFTPGPTDIVPNLALIDILDHRLTDNGGPTPTHALVFGSPAVDVVPRSLLRHRYRSAQCDQTTTGTRLPAATSAPSRAQKLRRPRRSSSVG